MILNTGDTLQKRGGIPDCDMLSATYHPSYDVATYVKQNIDSASLVSASSEGEIHNVAVKIGSITVTNTYKPPAISWPAQVIRSHPYPAIFVGNFNSHQ